MKQQYNIVFRWSSLGEIGLGETSLEDDTIKILGTKVFATYLLLL